MSIELSSLLRAAARKESVAAERAFPMSQAIVARYIGAARLKRSTRVVVIAAAAAMLIGGGALGLAHWWPGSTPAIAPTPSATWSSSQEPSASPTPSAAPSATPSPSAPLPTESAAPPAINETTPPAPRPPVAVAVPGQVITVSAGPGGGSGETLVAWDAVAGADGYMVYRSASAAGPFVESASVVAATGVTTVEFSEWYEYIQIWQPAPDAFQYVEAIDNVHAYFQVAAFNAAGTGPRSATVCGTPLTAAEGC